MPGTNNYVGAIEGFKSQIKSIQRASLFDVTITNFKYFANGDTENSTETSGQGQTSNTMGNMLKFSVKAATFPAATVGDLAVNYMGRVIHWYGDRQYAGTWATTCILDGQWKIFNAIYAWNQGMGGANRIVSEDLNMHQHFKCDAFVTAYSTDGQAAHSIMLKGLWPQDIGEISMDWSSTDAAVDLAVTWVYDYIITDPGQAIDTNVGSNTAISTLEGGGSTSVQQQGNAGQAGTTYFFTPTA